MKSLFCIIATILLLPSCNSLQNESGAHPAIEVPQIIASAENPLLKRHKGILYLNEIPFSGILQETFANGTIKSQTEYYNGKRHGRAISKYPDGLLYSERYYRGGKKHGIHKGWWQNGNMKFRYEFADGNYHDENREWYETGELSKLFHYVNGEETGQQQAWRENGKLYVNYIVKNGKRYGMVKSRLCYSVKDGEGQYFSKNN